MMTADQYIKLRDAILADPALHAYPNTTDGNTDMCKKELNVEFVPKFTVWQSRVPKQKVADDTFAVDLANITALNLDRYNTIMNISPDGVVPTLDRRTAFEAIFSAAAGADTRAKLGLNGTTWKRVALYGEKILMASGTGTDASPATLGYEGNILDTDVTVARNL